MLQSRLTCSLVAKFPQHSVVACSTQISCCGGRMLQTRQQMGVCEPLMPNVVAPKEQSQLCELSGPTFRFITQTWWAVTRRTQKNQKTVKIGVWALSQDNTVSVTPHDQDVNDYEAVNSATLVVSSTWWSNS